MGYRNLRECVDDLQQSKQLVRIEQEIDPHLEAAAIHRRVFQAKGPALYFSQVKGCRFPMVCNLFGTIDRARFLFRDMLRSVEHLVKLKIEPAEFWKHPFRFRDVPRTLWCLRPRFVSSGPVTANQTTIDQLPKLQCWPKDGGAFITLPTVYTEDATRPGWRHSNLGMYRIQMSGGQYQLNRQVGMHYQIHRGIGVHHAKAIQEGKPFRVTIWVGGPPSLMVSAVMPLPEGMPELAFAGALGGRRVDLYVPRADKDAGTGMALAAEADFCITGTVDPKQLLPEGPFGDHLGYYSLAHPFPVLNVEKVYHRADAIWPFTVVGRPPQEDTAFGQLVHEITGPIIPTVLHGVHAVHAVDAAGVHPLLLAQGSERYVPYLPRQKPMELLTQSHAILGQGQLSLAKYLLIVAREDNPDLDIHDIPAFFRHFLERVDWKTDLHFQTSTTIDTLDYSGTALNEGSKVVMAAVGQSRRLLPSIPPVPLRLPDGFSKPRGVMHGILAIQAPPYHPDEQRRVLEGPALHPSLLVQSFCDNFKPTDLINNFPLVVLVDDSDFVAKSFSNFLWVTFTRSNPAVDIHGITAFLRDKHFGCEGSLVIDARSKPHHAPPLEEDPEVSKRVDALGAPGGPLHGII